MYLHNSSCYYNETNRETDTPEHSSFITTWSTWLPQDTTQPNLYVTVTRKHSPCAVLQLAPVCWTTACWQRKKSNDKEWKHQERWAASDAHTSNEHTPPTSAHNTAPNTLNCVLLTSQSHGVLGELRENYKRYLSPLFPLTVIRSFHVPGVLFTLPRFRAAQGWEM